MNTKKTYFDSLFESVLLEIEASSGITIMPDEESGADETKEDIFNEKIYTIPKSELEEIQKKINKLNTRTSVTDTPAVYIEVVNEYFLPISNFVDNPEYQDQQIEAVDVIVKGTTTPIVSDWLFVAIVRPTLTTDRNVIHQIPGSNIEIPSEYRVGMPPCEACCEDRKRTELYLVYSTKTSSFKTVGSSCLQKFVGAGFNPDSIMAYVDIVKKIRELLNGINLKNQKTARRIYSKPNLPKDMFWIPIKKFISKVLQIIEKNYKGWPKRMIQNQIRNIAIKAYQTSFIEVTGSADQLADEIVKWGTTTLQQRPVMQLDKDDANLQALFKKGFLDADSIYNVTRGVLMYLDENIPQPPLTTNTTTSISASVNKPTEHKIGDDITVETIISGIYRNDGQYGPYYTIQTKDKNGIIYFWYVGDKMMYHYAHVKQGGKYKVSGKIKNVKSGPRYQIQLPVKAIAL